MEIFPHPSRGTSDPLTERIIPVTISIDRSVDLGSSDAVLAFVTSDGTEDRHGSRINPEGWDDAPYRQNPVVLWSHQTTVPAIGRAENISRVGGRGTSLVRFAIEQWRAEGIGNLAQHVFQLCRDGFLNMGSESFLPKKWREMEAQTVPSLFAENVYYERVEKTEFSIVNVGSNRNALIVRGLLDEGKISENEAGLLGLGMMLRFESPIVIQPRTVTPPADEQPVLQVDRGAFRASVREIVTRCCGCDPYYGCETEPVEQVDEATKVAEIALVNALAADCLQDLDTAINGWRVAESDDLRGVCSSRVGYAMSLYDWLDWWLERTYDEEIGATLPDINFTDLGEIAAAAPEAFNRAGAVFSSANLSKIRSLKDSLAQGMQHCEDLIAASKKEDSDGTVQNDAPPGSFRVIGASSERQIGEGAFVVPATDASARREEDLSTPGERQPLYRVLLNG
jgi:hypothetical protein